MAPRRSLQDARESARLPTRDGVTMRRLAAVTLIGLTMVAAAQNPYMIWCDYHSTYFSKTGRDYPSGKCYDVYTHWYTERGRQLTHTASMPCDR